jgi:hypothetical protein
VHGIDHSMMLCELHLRLGCLVLGMLSLRRVNCRFLTDGSGWFQHSNSHTTRCMSILCMQTSTMARAVIDEGSLDVMQQVGVV